MYAVAKRHRRCDKLFKTLEDGSVEFIFYDPVTHEPTSHPVSFSQSTNFSGGTALESFKERWYV